jgi:PEP-CTERM/exosortase A-associated glycosyltransferase
MKILHVLEYSLPYLVGYTIRSKYIVENQKKIGLEPIIITSPLMTQNTGSYPAYEEINKIKYYRSGYLNRISESDRLSRRLLKRYIYSKEYKKAILMTALAEKPDIIHAHSSYLNGISANFVSKKLNLPSIYEVRGLWQDSAVINQNIGKWHWKYNFVNYMDKKAMKESDIIIAISECISKELQHKGIKKSKIRVVPNGVDVNIFSPCQPDMSIIQKYNLSGKVVIGFIGSVRRIEGLMMVIEAMPKIINQIGNVIFLIVGDGDNEIENLKKLSHINGLEKNVVFCGRIKHEDIVQYYSIMDLLVYPRINAKVNQKVTPLKPLEAMAMEKAVLASDVGGLREIVDNNKNGILFSVDDKDDFLDKIIQLLSDRNFRTQLGGRARSWVIRERDWQNVTKKYTDIYKELGLRLA